MYVSIHSILSTSLCKIMRINSRSCLILSWVTLLVALWSFSSLKSVYSHRDHPFARIAIEKTVLDQSDTASSVNVSPSVLGTGGRSIDWVNVNISNPNPSDNDWIGVFSPSNLSSSTCAPENDEVLAPLLCTAPIKYKYVRYGNPNYKNTGKASLKFQLINQRSDFSFALFSGDLSKPKLVTVSNTIAFANPNLPNYPRLAQGKLWNQMTVTWTSGYGRRVANPFIEWGKKGENQTRTIASTMTFNRNQMCGAPAKTVGWRDPGYFHTSFLSGLLSDSLYTYKMGHKLSNGTIIWSNKVYEFKSSPKPGQDSLQRIVIFGDMGKDEVDGSNEYNQYQHGSINTTKQLINDLNNTDLIFHIGDLSYAQGYLSQWDQFTSQIEPMASSVPYMIASGNHERDWPESGSFYETEDSGGECGVVAESMFYFPAQNKTKFWYVLDYGMFRFCVADSETDWTEGSEQYKFIEKCLATVNRKKRPWLIFIAHRVLGYSTSWFYDIFDTYGEIDGKESLENLWQKYNVDIAIYGHAHNYERTCPMYQSNCTNNGNPNYTGSLNGTIHVVAGGGGASLTQFARVSQTWSLFRDYDYGFLKLTSFNRSKLLFEYKKSSDGKVYDSFTISRD